jgi:hypothetical protein
MARMEVEVHHLKTAFEEHKHTTERNFNELKDKLDDLLELRNKGVGAFWLASGLFGTGVLGVIYSLFGWLRG